MTEGGSQVTEEDLKPLVFEGERTCPPLTTREGGKGG